MLRELQRDLDDVIAVLEGREPVQRHDEGELTS
jgi:hypothetical protein